MTLDSDDDDDDDDDDHDDFCMFSVYLCVNSFWTSISGGSRLAVWGGAALGPFPSSPSLPLLSFPIPFPFHFPSAALFYSPVDSLE